LVELALSGSHGYGVAIGSISLGSNIVASPAVVGGVCSWWVVVWLAVEGDLHAAFTRACLCGSRRERSSSESNAGEGKNCGGDEGLHFENVKARL